MFVAQYSSPLNYKPSFVDTGLRFELRISDSNSDVLPITLSGIISGPGRPDSYRENRHIIVSETIASSVGLQACFYCGSYESRTHSNRSTICDVNRYTNEPSNLYGTRTRITRMKILRPGRLNEQTNLYRRQDSNLQPLHSR